MRKAPFLFLAAAVFILVLAGTALAGQLCGFTCTRNTDGSVTIRWSGGEEGETLAITRLDIFGRRLGPAVEVGQAKGEFRDNGAPAETFYYEVAWGPLRRSAVFLAVPGLDESNILPETPKTGEDARQNPG